MPQQAHVLYCVQFDAQTNTCAVETWMPAPQLLPPLSFGDVGLLLTGQIILFSVVWGLKMVNRTIRQ